MSHWNNWIMRNEWMRLKKISSMNYKLNNSSNKFIYKLFQYNVELIVTMKIRMLIVAILA